MIPELKDRPAKLGIEHAVEKMIKLGLIKSEADLKFKVVNCGRKGIDALVYSIDFGKYQIDIDISFIPKNGDKIYAGECFSIDDLSEGETNYSLEINGERARYNVTYMDGYTALIKAVGKDSVAKENEARRKIRNGEQMQRDIGDGSWVNTYSWIDKLLEDVARNYKKK